jgi:hypothetical protein
MILAKFSEEEAGCKSMQRKVSRDAQKVAAATGKKGKARPSSVSASESSPPIEEVNFSEDQSPNSMSSVTEEDDDTRKKPPKKEKKHRLNAKQMQEKQEKAKWVLETKGSDDKDLLGSDLDALLTYYNCPKRNTLANVEGKKRAWRKMKEKGLLEPIQCTPWTDEEESMLLEAGKECTDVMDTALGRAKRRKMQQCKIALREMSDEEIQEILAARDNAANVEASEGAFEAV